MNQPSESIVVAMTSARVIGLGGAIPWRIAAEHQHFRRLTWGGTLIMGRATFAGIGRPLPGRRNIVVSTTCAPAPGLTVCRSFAEAVEEARRHGDPLFYIGGVQIYRQALLRADFLEISWVRLATPGDRFFPPFAAGAWREVVREDHDAFVHVRYQRS